MENKFSLSRLKNLEKSGNLKVVRKSGKIYCITVCSVINTNVEKLTQIDCQRIKEDTFLSCNVVFVALGHYTELSYLENARNVITADI